MGGGRLHPRVLLLRGAGWSHLRRRQNCLPISWLSPSRGWRPQFWGKGGICHPGSAPTVSHKLSVFALHTTHRTDEEAGARRGAAAFPWRWSQDGVTGCASKPGPATHASPGLQGLGPHQTQPPPSWPPGSPLLVHRLPEEACSPATSSCRIPSQDSPDQAFISTSSTSGLLGAPCPAGRHFSA